ncbi:MAG: DUF4349 domain-containing protein [Polyangiales bacterium]
MNTRQIVPRLVVAVGLSAALSACASGSHYARAMAPPGPMRLEQAAGSAVAEETAPAPAPAAPPGQPGIAAGPATNTGASTPSASTTPSGETAPAAAPMLIYTAEFALRVERERFGDVLDRVLANARERGGYLVSRNDTSIQVRVPSARFHESVTAVEGSGEVLRRNVAASDVSEEFHDAEVRLQNLRAVRQRLEEFLRRAGSMAEALQVERELERVTAEIDRLQGRMRFLSARVAFSLISVALEPRPTVIAAPRTQEVVPPRRVLNLPVRWLHELGLDRLLNLSGED